MMTRRGRTARPTTALPGRLVLLACVCGLAALVHANSLVNGFAQDDDAVIVHNERVHGIGRLGLAVTAPYWPHTPGRLALYRPVTSASFAIDWSLWGGRPFGFHLVNVLLHVAVTGALFLLLLELASAAGARGPVRAGGAAVPGAALAGAAAGAVVFAVHPVHVEAVANVVGRAELLAALSFLAACLAYRRGGSGWGAAAATAVLYFVALGSKEIAVTLPLVLAGLHVVGAPSARAALVEATARWRVYALCGAALLVHLALRAWVTGVTVGGDVAPWFWGEPASTRIWTAVRLWPEYARLMFYPARLSPDYAPGVILSERHWLAPRVVLGFVTAAAAGGAAALLWQRARLAAVGVAWFAVTVLPVSGLLVENSFLLAERTLYLPSVGLSLGAAGVVGWLTVDRPGAARPALAALLLWTAAASVRTWVQNPVWRSDETLFAYLVETHPASYRARLERAAALAAAGLEDEVIEQLEAAVALAPGHFNVRLELGRLLYRRGRHLEAAAHFDVARRIAPEVELAHLLYLASLREAGRHAEAAAAGAEVAARFPHSSAARELLESSGPGGT